MKEDDMRDQDIRKILETIEPSIPRPRRPAKLFPCSAVLVDGREVNHLLVLERRLHLGVFGAPFVDSIRGVSPADIVALRECPCRLPAQFANELYESGETGMGFIIFGVVFRDKTCVCYGSSSGPDFMVYPPGKTGADVIGVISHGVRGEKEIYVEPAEFCVLGAPD